jgi:cobalt-zinc-cadmium efflux system outer membrane protein
MRERAIGARAALVSAALCAVLALGAPAAAAEQAAPGPTAAQAPFERVSFRQAVARALERHPSVGEAEQAIRRSQALLDEAKAVFRPTLYGNAGATMLDDARGFGGFTTQPRTQTVWSATAAYPVLDTARWKGTRQARDRVGIARISLDETRLRVALAAAQAYLAVIAAERQREIALRNLETGRALDDYARARLEAGRGSRLNHVRSTQERQTAEVQLQVAELLVRRAQEALGIALFADAPLDAAGEAELEPAAPPPDDSWLMRRPDVRLFSAEFDAADRIARDAWTLWMPTGRAFFTPQHVNPKGGFEPASTWRLGLQLQLPIYDGTLGPTKRVYVADREAARYRLDNVKAEARGEARLAQETVRRNEQTVATSRLSAESAAEALRITELAYRAGATSNIEVVQAQQTARNTEVLLAIAEDALRLARLDLLVALGLFP